MEKNQIPYGSYVKIIVTFLSPIVVNWKVLRLLYNEAINHDLSTHILLIPFLVLYILYKERGYIKTVISLEDYDKDKKSKILEVLSGVILFLLAFIIKLYGSIIFYSLEYNSLSIPVLISGIILIFFGYKTLKSLYFPIFMLLFLVPPPSLLAQQIGSFLATYGAYFSYYLLKTVGMPATLSMDYEYPIIYVTMRTGNTVPFSIDIGCSGIYSLIGFIIFAIFVSYISKGSIRNKLYILIMGFPLLYVLNVFRITLLLIVGYLFGENIALNVFHLLGGWTLIILGTVFLLTVSERFLKVTVFSGGLNTCEHTNVNNLHCVDCGKVLKAPLPRSSVEDVGKLAFIMLVTIILFSFRIPIFTFSNITSEIVIDESSDLNLPITILPNIEGYDLKFAFRDYEFENITKQDASVMYRYMPHDSEDSMFWVGLEIADTRGACHPWEHCLITFAGQYKATQVDLRDETLSEDPPISARYFAFIEHDHSYIQLVLYWYTLSNFKTSTGYEQKWAKISLITYVDNRDEVLREELRLLPYAKEIATHWEPVSTWSTTFLSIARDGIVFINILLGGLACILLYSLYLLVIRKRSARKLYDHISDEVDKSIIKAIISLDCPSYDSNIKEKVAQLTGEDLTHETLSRKLEAAKSLGLVRKSITKVDDEPRLVWKTNF